MAYSVRAYMEQLIEDLWQGDLEGMNKMARPVNQTLELVKSVRGFANKKACMDEGQAKFLLDMILHDKRELPELHAVLVPMVNSFRYDCEHCLNSDCVWRDENTSVLEVQAAYDPTYKSISAFDPSPMTVHLLRKAGISTTLQSLSEMSKEDLGKIPEFDEHCIKDVKHILAKFGMTLRGAEMPSSDPSPTTLRSSR